MCFYMFSFRSGVHEVKYISGGTGYVVMLAGEMKFFSSVCLFLTHGYLIMFCFCPATWNVIFNKFSNLGVYPKFCYCFLMLMML